MKKETSRSNTLLPARAKKKKRLIIALCITVGVLLVLFVLSETVLPRLVKNRSKSAEPYEGGETRLFYDETRFTDEDAAEYASYVQNVRFKNILGIETLVTDGDYETAGGAEAVLFGNYIEAIRNGDSAAYAACFSERYDFENGLDRFADGKDTFPPQRLYDISIEALDTFRDEETGITQSLYDVRYRIYKNTGDFRNDMTDDIAPLLFVVETKDGKTVITDIAYRYGND